MGLSSQFKAGESYSAKSGQGPGSLSEEGSAGTTKLFVRLTPTKQLVNII